MEAPPAPRRPLAPRLAAAILLPAASLAAAEATVRLVDLTTLDRAAILDQDRRAVADLAEIAGFFGDPDGTPPPGSMTQLPCGAVSYGWYDRPRWSYFDTLGCIEYRFNSLGFRDAEFPREKPAGERRVLALGDSFTFACGVRLEDCWVERLEDKLAAARGAPAQVVNAGFAHGFRPDMYADWLEERGVALDPDAVIVGLCLNDISAEVPMYLPLEPHFEPWLGGKSRLLAELQRRLGPPLPAPAPNPIRARRLVQQHTDEWGATRSGLRRIRDCMAARGGRLLVVVFPMFSQLASGYLFGELHELVRDACAEDGIDRLDLLPVFAGTDERELWVHPTDQHPNDVGQERIAAAIADWAAQNWK